MGNKEIQVSMMEDASRELKQSEDMLFEEWRCKTSLLSEVIDDFETLQNKVVSARRLLISLMQSSPSPSTSAICHQVLETLK
jgi:hypothetical protein